MGSCVRPHHAAPATRRGFEARKDGFPRGAVVAVLDVPDRAAGAAQRVEPQSRDGPR